MTPSSGTTCSARPTRRCTQSSVSLKASHLKDYQAELAYTHPAPPPMGMASNERLDMDMFVYTDMSQAAAAGSHPPVSSAEQGGESSVLPFRTPSDPALAPKNLSRRGRLQI